ncbi:dihydrolipoyllysine-residue acetyltransferase component 1 of pyruvate dehydrogenase complex [Forsythia ovata]|uniref:Dihydrolipoyllysine-residue acetyltransferase component 1 of pyruvate dehydrogenase complex n=1 Tax=Forsythia ovata TaxID=205694 RepID=A0ABD1WA39_9LAMI
MDKIVVMLDVKLNSSSKSHESKHVEEGFLANLLVLECLNEAIVEQPIAITVEDPNGIHAVKTIVSGYLSVKEESHVQCSANKGINQTSLTRISPFGKNTQNAGM